MPFKIVQTIENGQPQLSICPAQWEEAGVLSWPKKKAAKKSKAEETMPKPHWLQINCILKRNNLLNYAAAEEELQAMLQNTDTELEQDQNQANSKKYMLENFNEQAEQLLTGTTSAVLNTIPCQLNTVIEPSTEYVIIDENPSSKNTPVASCEILTVLANIMNNQKIISESINTVLENQKKIIMTMAEFSTKLETIKIQHDRSRETSVNVLRDVTNTKSTFCLKPIKDINELESLEEELNYEEFRTDYKNKYSMVCSPGKGINCAYQLVDLFFNREFLTKCSWSGSARGEGTKISFKTYKNILHLFFQLVHDCDNSFTFEDNTNFFKAILKNAVKRKNAKLQRTTTARNRPKRQKMSLDRVMEHTMDTQNVPVDVILEVENTDGGLNLILN